ncbi:MAG: MaoC family dehydratase [Promethearchaeota archaeon]
MSQNNLKPVKWENYNIGDSAKHVKTVTETEVEKFAEITGDYNPIHVNEDYAKTTMFGRRIAHGVLSVGLISACLGVKMFGPGILYGSQQATFKKPVFLGDTLKVVCTITDKFTKKEGKLKFLTVETKVYNQDNLVVTDGEAQIIFA